MFMTAAIAENPAVMTASGHKVENDGSVSVDNYNDPGVIQLREKALPTAVKAGLLGGTGVYALAAYGPLAMVNFGMKNIALPVLGGEVVNEVTRKVSDNKYNSFGDFVYNNTPLSKLKDGTDSNIFVKGFSEMFNPAYLFPYGKAVKTTMDGVQSAVNTYNNLPVKIKFGPRENFRYRNIGDDLSGVEDLYNTGQVLAPKVFTQKPKKGINLNKEFNEAFFGYSGQLVNSDMYPGKYFLGTVDKNFIKPFRNQWGYSLPKGQHLNLEDVTINKRIFQKLFNGKLYIEYAPTHFSHNKINFYKHYEGARKIRNMSGFNDLGQSRWFANLFDEKNLLGEGLSKKVYIYPDGDHVIKLGKPVNPFKYKEWLDPKNMSRGQYIMPDGFKEIPNLEYQGVRVLSDGKLQPVFKQKIIIGHHPESSEVLKTHGYVKVPDSFGEVWTKNGVVFKDIHPNNIIVDAEGIPHIIDDEFTNVNVFNPLWKKQ